MMAAALGKMPTTSVRRSIGFGDCSLVRCRLGTVVQARTGVVHDRASRPGSGLDRVVHRTSRDASTRGLPADAS
jgi:hypothetical protein